MPLLPKDLQRFTTDGQTVSPQYVKPSQAVMQIAEQLLDCFRFSPDDNYGALVSAVEPLCLQSQRHRLIKGLIHILESHLVFADDTDVDPVQLRMALFKKAALVKGSEFVGMQWRERIAGEVCEEFHIHPEDLDNTMYSDLKDERKILSFEDMEPEQLIAEYNLTLAKSLLLYARKLTFTVDLGQSTAQSLRRLFRGLRFFNLLFDAQPLTDSIWQFAVDGPDAVLPQPQKYATSLASFLPVLFSFETWHATSTILLDENSYQWQLKPKDFEAPVIRLPERIPEEALQLQNRIPQLDARWEIVHDYPVITFGPQCAWVPDFSMKNRETQGVVHIEILGFWRADYLNRRLHLLEKAPNNLILVLSDRLKVDKVALEKTDKTILFYKRTPRAQDIIKAAETCACRS